MSFASETGYIPQSIDSLMDLVMVGINEQFGTAYTTETFLGTNFYKYYYALIQRLQEAEVRTAEIVALIQQYFIDTNQKIQRPIVTYPGIIDYFKQKGWVASCKPMIEADAGKIHICVLRKSSDPTATADKLAVNTIVKDCTAGGVVSMGDQVNALVLSNGQTFDFKHYLPDRHAIKLKLTITTSVNNQYTIGTVAQVKAILDANIAARYRLGLDFEPARYFTVLDAPWASVVKLEYSLDGGSTWLSVIYSALFDDLLEYISADTSVVFN